MGTMILDQGPTWRHEALQRRQMLKEASLRLPELLLLRQLSPVGFQMGIEGVRIVFGDAALEVSASSKLQHFQSQTQLSQTLQLPAHVR